MKPLFILAASLLPVVVAFAACGSDDSTSPGAADGGGDGSSSGSSSGTSGASSSGGSSSGGSSSGGSSSGGSSSGGSSSGDSGPGFDAGASVIQHHKNATRDGVFVDGKLTKTAVAGMKLDANFNATMQGPTYAQPLFLDGAINGKDVLVVATEQNVVYTFDATTGAQIWKTPALATPVARANLPCGNIDPLGITGTPYVDLQARTIYLGAMTTPDNGTTKKHMIYALSLDDGSVRQGWPVDVGAKVTGFLSEVQNQRGAVLVQDGILYVPYGGHYGDCGDYHGWLVGVDVANPGTVKSWATPAREGGAWCAGGVSTDGTSFYITTGNTTGTNGTWGGGDAVIRLGKGPVFSNATADYYAPSNWVSLDNADLDMGTHALINAPGVTPSSLVAGFGKDGNIYLLDHANLGGIGKELTKLHAGTGEITGAVTTYTTPAGTFIAFRIDGGQGIGCTNNPGGNMAAVKISAGTPPKITAAWCAKESDQSLPITSMTTAAGAEAIVWNMGSGLYAYDAETGTEIFSGGGTQLKNTRYFNTPIIAKGRVFVAGDNQVYAFTP